VPHTASPIVKEGLPAGSTVAIADDFSLGKLMEALGKLEEADAAKVCVTFSCHG
jgi:hypothetical protein